MRRVGSVSIVLIALLLVACGKGTVGPAPVNGVLLRAADLPDMRLRSSSPVLDASAFNDVVGHGDLFKDPAKKVVKQLESHGFLGAYAEEFTGDGTRAAAFVAKFAPGKDISGMLTYMNTNLFEECPGAPQCSVKSILKVSGVPDSFGQTLKPNRDPNEGKPLTVYKVVFRVGSLIFGMLIGGDEGLYDPGTISQSRALEAIKTYYNSVKGKSADQIFKVVPANGRGSGGPPPPGGSPSP